MISVMVTPIRSSTTTLAARDQTVVDIDIDRLADLAVELDNRALAQSEQLADLHRRFAEHRRNLNRDIEYRLEIGGAFRDLAERRGVVALLHGGGRRIADFFQGEIVAVSHHLLLKRGGFIGP